MIYPKILQFPTAPNTPYMPSNGTEGGYWESVFCNRCKHDNPSELPCGILMNAHCGTQPAEWQRDEKGYPRCTKWSFFDWTSGEVPEAEPKVDPKQLSLF